MLYGGEFYEENVWFWKFEWGICIKGVVNDGYIYYSGCFGWIGKY